MKALSRSESNKFLILSSKAGDRVWFYGSLSGSHAELSLCKESTVFSLPESIDFEQGAAIGVPYLTAYRAVFHKY